MDGISRPQTIKETRQRFCDLARILENHGVAWDYDVLIDLDLYISSQLWRKRVQ